MGRTETEVTIRRIGNGYLIEPLCYYEDEYHASLEATLEYVAKMFRGEDYELEGDDECQR